MSRFHDAMPTCSLTAEAGFPCIHKICVKDAGPRLKQGGHNLERMIDGNRRKIKNDKMHQ